jgi:hypothetical protein
VKIFISHSAKDYELAKILKNILEESESIKEVFVYEDEKRFGIQISDKITNEIDSSDYLVALITKNSVESASVNQEYGYAQAKKLQKIPFLEKGADEGVMIYGTEKIVFSKENFSEKCFDVKHYLLNNKVLSKTTDDEKFFIQKSAHFRYELEQILSSFIDAYLIRFVDEYRDDRGLFTEEQRIKAQKLFQRDIINKQEFFNKIYKQTIRDIEIIYEDCDQFKNRYEQITRFPHADFLPDEQDALIKLNERIQPVLVDSLPEFLRAQNNGILDLDMIFREFIIQTRNNTNRVFEPSVYLMDLRFFLKSIESMFDTLQKIRVKYGKLAFQSTYDDETV